MKRLTTIRQLIYLSAFLVFAVALLLPLGIARAEDEAVFSLWIPATRNGNSDNGGNGGNNPPPPPPPPPPAEPVAWRFFADPQWNTNSASMVTDAKGGIHLAYHYYEAAGDGAPRHGVYEYCPSACDKTENWKSLAIGENVNEIQLELTPEGNPRLLYRVSSSNNGQIFYYAECNQNCTQAAGWNGAAVASNQGMATLELSDDERPQRYFELDPQGRPRFVYGDYNYFVEPDHIGTFYAYCDGGCTAASNWAETKINKESTTGSYRSEDFYYPVLAFTPAGQPRVLAEGYTMYDEPGLHYVACDTACENAANWQSALLWERGSGTEIAYDIETDVQGRPRVAYYDGARLNGEGNWLYYGWCNQGCTEAANWDRYNFGFIAGEGQEPDLELDAEGKPHMGYIIASQGGGLAYGRCTANCESHQSQWTHVGLESGTDLASAWNVAYPPHCDGGFWQGLTPTLSLDKNGNAAFAYDGTYHARCWYNDVTKQWEEYSYIHLIQRSVRTYFLPKP
jgi:hypothetical protein